ncbi:MAG: retroviral-like aspartic protease family protein [Betaproteobacteria bacterium]|nr:retroviral-like aspartic protease family protein [Betaproteobacteria bacterium]
MRHSISVFLLVAAALPASAQTVSLVGVIGDKAAIIAVDGGEPKTVKVGQKWSGVTVLSVQHDQATIEVGGTKRVLARGQHFGAASTAPDRQKAVLAADERGHFIVEGAVNGLPIRFLVDTGASTIALPAREADRIGIQYLNGQRGISRTAAGPVTVWRVRLDSVRVGTIELSGVEAVVIEQGLDIPLLGMTFLNRTEMKRDGQTMTLLRRF